jgi:hypothetical protein
MSFFLDQHDLLIGQCEQGVGRDLAAKKAQVRFSDLWLEDNATQLLLRLEGIDAQPRLEFVGQLIDLRQLETQQSIRYCRAGLPGGTQKALQIWFHQVMRDGVVFHLDLLRAAALLSKNLQFPI